MATGGRENHSPAALAPLPLTAAAAVATTETVQSYWHRIRERGGRGERESIGLKS